MEVQLYSNIFIFWLQVLKPIIELYHIYIYIYNIKKNIHVDGLFSICKMVEIHHKKNYIINIYFRISKKLDKDYNDFKD
jgi:hypothetical protein